LANSGFIAPQAFGAGVSVDAGLLGAVAGREGGGGRRGMCGRLGRGDLELAGRTRGDAHDVRVLAVLRPGGAEFLGELLAQDIERPRFGRRGGLGLRKLAGGRLGGRRMPVGPGLGLDLGLGVGLGVGLVHFRRLGRRCLMVGRPQRRGRQTEREEGRSQRQEAGDSGRRAHRGDLHPRYRRWRAPT
jgi:hypothetical protein